MKKLISSLSLIWMLALVMVACSKKDSTIPELSTSQIEDYDLIQVSNDMRFVPVKISNSDNKIMDSISIRIVSANGTVVARNVVRQINNSNIEQMLVQVPFPLPAVAPTGLYDVIIVSTDAKGNTTERKYKVNISNVQTAAPSVCSFPNAALPAGRTVWIQVTAPANTNGEDIFITGNFEGAQGGADWSGGGNNTFKLNRIAGTNCYFIAATFSSATEFKITRGDWGKRIQNENGQDVDNLRWNGQATQQITVRNWSDRVVLAPPALPTSMIQSGFVTVTVDLPTDYSNTDNYYLVRRGGNLNDRSNPLVLVTGTTRKMVGKVPKDQAAEYLVVKNVSTSIGVNVFGIQQAAKWDGISNPINIALDKFSDQGPFITIPTSLFLVGGATPGGWNNPVPVPSQQFTSRGNNVFDITIALSTGSAYLILPVNGSWGEKFGGSSKTGGPLVYQGPDIPSPDVNGNYKITVNLNTSSYSVVRQ